MIRFVYVDSSTNFSEHQAYSRKMCTHGGVVDVGGGCAAVCDTIRNRVRGPV